MPPKEKFNKPPLPIGDLVRKLEARGLRISDKAKAVHYLKHIGYYRLGGYLRFFQMGDTNHTYKSDATFEDVLALYIFDRRLRLLVMDAMERIEVAARTALSNMMSLKYGAHWYLDQQHFHPGFNHADFLDKVRTETGFSDSRRQTEFARHYYSKYNDPALPPSWMVIEIMSLGTWSKVYSQLARGGDKKEIAGQFSLPPGVFESWLRSLTVLRNICAHHSCLWNQRFKLAPIEVHVDGAKITNTGTFYGLAAVIQKLLGVIAPDSGWSQRLRDLIHEHPVVQTSEMGFPGNWEHYAFWKISRTSKASI